MRRLSLKGGGGGKKVITTRPDTPPPCPDQPRLLIATEN